MNKALLCCLVIGVAGCSSSARIPSTESNASVAQSQDGLSQGEILYGYRCKGCHEPATPGAPNRKELAGYEQDEIVRALTRGEMKSLAQGLTKGEMRQIAAFLTKSSG